MMLECGLSSGLGIEEEEGEETVLSTAAATGTVGGHGLVG